MDNVKEQKEKIESIMKQLDEVGFTPFDLLSWHSLLDLNSKMKVSGMDLTFGFELSEALLQALERKAVYLNKLENTDFYTNLVKGWKNSGLL